MRRTRAWLDIIPIAIRRSESHVRLQAAALFPQARYEKRAVRMGTQLHEEFARDYPVGIRVP